MANPTSGPPAIAYTTDANVLYSMDCTPTLPSGAVPTGPGVVVTNTGTGAAHPEMLVGTPTVAGNLVYFVLTAFAVGQYQIVVDYAPSPPGATGERLTCAPALLTVPS